MNTSAQQHLAKAKDYVARGEEFYRKAAEEIEWARNEGVTLDEIAEALGKSRKWVSETLKWYLREGEGTPFAEPQGVVAKRHARSVLRDAPPEQIAEMLDTPEIRANVSKALDRHYSKRAEAATEARHERRVEDRGGEEAHVEHEHRQRLAELVNVMRGAVSALRFAAGQAKGLDLDADETGAAEELSELVEEIVGFGSMLKEYLAGREITDEDIAQLIGSES